MEKKIDTETILKTHPKYVLSVGSRIILLNVLINTIIQQSYPRMSIPVVGRLLWRHNNSTSSHTLCPTDCNSRPPPDPPEGYCLQLVSHLQSYSLA